MKHGHYLLLPALVGVLVAIATPSCYAAVARCDFPMGSADDESVCYNLGGTIIVKKYKTIQPGYIPATYFGTVCANASCLDGAPIGSSNAISPRNGDLLVQ
jgi:hypothetical protein